MCGCATTELIGYLENCKFPDVNGSNPRATLRHQQASLSSSLGALTFALHDALFSFHYKLGVRQTGSSISPNPVSHQINLQLRLTSATIHSVRIQSRPTRTQTTIISLDFDSYTYAQMVLLTPPDEWLTSPPTFPNDAILIFYSDIDASGQMWCPDCRRVKSTVDWLFNGRVSLL
jgi:hypothetical protein